MEDQWSRFKRSACRHLAFMPAETFDYSLNISLRHNYLFVETPKVCCSTIKLNLQRLETNNPNFSWPDPMDVHNRAFSPLLKPSQLLDFESLLGSSRLYTFCFVRNPYTRLLSCYIDKILGNRPPKRQVLNILGLDCENIDQAVSFSQFIEVVSSQSIMEMNPHWRPQYHQTLQTSLTYDFVGRYENFAEDFRNVCSRISADFSYCPARETRHRTNANQKVKEFYTKSLLREVRRIYDIDFTHFGYGEV